MNRFVLIGNGFDLAHGFATGYGNFLYNYFIKHLKIANENENLISEDELVQVLFIKKLRIVDKNLHETIDSFDGLLESEFIDWGVNNKAGVSSKSFHVIIKYKSDFFKELIKESNWTDIEKSYFDCLIQTFENSKTSKILKDKFEKNLKNLNISFSILTSKIIEYLKDIDDNRIKPLHPLSLQHESLFENCLSEPDLNYIKRYFSKSFINSIVKDEIRNDKLENIHFINFNYTTLLNKYITNIQTKINILNYPIHGNIDNDDSIIFGYGDDSHSSYQSLEDENKPDLLKYVKSFYYPDKKHYLSLINALDESEFDVFVIGHSLGLSDRVLLRTIFEHEHCRAIKLIHRGSMESQFQMRISLSRHFSDKAIMRSRIVDYDARDRFW